MFNLEKEKRLFNKTAFNFKDDFRSNCMPLSGSPYAGFIEFNWYCGISGWSPS